ncbi:hypothetical protein ACFVUH_18275 [Kitasatospora sp. NPDC058032]|uniref:hypothetical protein n=1 Tax=Kitasatospora sp. NPDC058032 TaxID=3346307 RepID=UPI0036DC3D26
MRFTRSKAAAIAADLDKGAAEKTKAAAIAADLDKGAAEKTKAAASGDAHAADKNNSPLSRQQARASASILRGQARDMRADADAIRDGVNPTELGYTD